MEILGYSILILLAPFALIFVIYVGVLSFAPKKTKLDKKIVGASLPVLLFGYTYFFYDTGQINIVQVIVLTLGSIFWGIVTYKDYSLQKTTSKILVLIGLLVFYGSHYFV